ncbi:MAG: hypothetical protein AAGI07_15935 [Bacteroidota bacterium]
MKTVFEADKVLAFHIAVILIFPIFILPNIGYAFNDTLRFNYLEIPKYEFQQSKYQSIFRMEYAQSAIKNPEAWLQDVREKKIVEIDLIFTQYPRKKEDWRTNYDTLLTRRINSVKEILKEAGGTSDIKWNLILQTACENEVQAKKMFHGAVVKYRPVLPKSLRASLNNVRKIVTGRVDFEDSVVFKVFERNPDWRDMLIIKDWTGSMYDYGAQAILWHRLNMKKKAVKKLIFFNDGNLTENSKKVIGETGGIYTAKPYDIKDVINVMREVMLEGNGGDSEENDVEALLYAINNSEDFNEVILIADNKSAVRDISLAENIDVPIRIILCGTKEAPVIHPHYLKIAYATGGSIHTLEKDITDLKIKLEGELITVYGVEYKMKDGYFIPVKPKKTEGKL